MSFSHPLPLSTAARSRGHAPFVAWLVLLVAAAGVIPAGAQQRVDVGRRAPRAEPMDSFTDRQLRRLQHQLDSLARVYSENDQLTALERRRVEDALARALDRIEEMSARANGEMAVRSMLPGEQIRIRMAPQVAERAAQTMSRALMQVAEDEQVRPRGWIGIVAEGPSLTHIEDGQLIVRYFSYPRIVSVDPSSPAQRAGLQPSDSLIAYDGRDVRESDISLTRLLRPSARVVVRIRRDGRLRDIPVTVAAAPSRIVQRREDEVRVRIPVEIAGSLPEAPSFPRAPMPPSPAVSAVRATTRQSLLAPVARATPSASARPPQRPAYAFGFSFNGVAGAQLTTITEGLGQTIGVTYGVLVTNAPTGLPAYESGLRDGDVIAKVGGQAVRTVPEVRDLVGLATENGERAIELEIVRQKRGQKILLKW